MPDVTPRDRMPMLSFAKTSASGKSLICRL